MADHQPETCRLTPRHILSSSIETLLDSLEQRHGAGRAEFEKRVAGKRDETLKLLKANRRRVLEAVCNPPTSPWCTDPTIEAIAAEIGDYAERADWAILDLLSLGCVSELSASQVAERSLYPSLLYFTLRMIDDIIDQHRDYKGMMLTTYGVFLEDPSIKETALAATLLPALLLGLEASRHLPESTSALAAQTIRGALAEAVVRTDWSVPRYRDMVDAKMVRYGLMMYDHLIGEFDRSGAKRLRDFLCECFTVGQLINDLQDIDSDRERGQPNFWTLGQPAGESLADFEEALQSLSAAGAALPGPLAAYGHARVANLVAYVRYVIAQTDTDEGLQQPE